MVLIHGEYSGMVRRLSWKILNLSWYSAEFKNRFMILQPEMKDLELSLYIYSGIPYRLENLTQANTKDFMFTFCNSSTCIALR